MSNPASGQADMSGAGPFSTTSTSTSDSKDKPWQQTPLSCSRCRQKKVRCNKTHPCAGCQRAGAECFYPRRQERLEARRQKARSHHTELIDRLSRLEGLVNKVESNANRAGSAVRFNEGVKAFRPGINLPRTDDHFQNQITELPVGTDGTLSDPRNGLIDRYISSDFWSNLSDRIIGIKELLDKPSYTEEDEDQEVPDERSPISNYTSPPDFIFGAESSRSPLPHPSIPQIVSLCNNYIAKVQPVNLVLHRPSLQLFVQDTINDLPNIPGGKSMEAILFVMYFAAVSSMAESECATLFGVPKDAVLPEYKRNAERALARADFLNKPEIASLQALAIYVFTIRAHDQGPVSWTLTPLVIRVAHGLGLHRELPGIHCSPYETEMRRRLWWELSLLDVRASEDRGSLPVICPGSYNTKKPANINDEEFGPQSESIVSSDGWKDSTFHLIIYDLTSVIKQLNYGIPSKVADGDPSLQRRQLLATEVHRRVEEKYLAHCNTAIPFQWFASKCTQLWFSRMQLMIQYPVQMRRPAPAKSCFKSDYILKTAMTAVECAYLLESNPDAPWFWCSRSWSSWHPLAIMLAELCIHTSGELADRAWTITGIVFEPWGKKVADASQGMLWRPIKKLYEKALQARTNGNGQMNENQGAGVPSIVDFASYPLTTMPTVLDDNLNLDRSALDGQWNTGITEEKSLYPGFEMWEKTESSWEADPNAMGWAWPFSDSKIFAADNHGFDYDGG